MKEGYLDICFTTKSCILTTDCIILITDSKVGCREQDGKVGNNNNNKTLIVALVFEATTRLLSQLVAHDF